MDDRLTRVTPRTIVITGASDGIGAAAARELRKSDANLVVIGRSQAKTEAVAAELDADHFVVDFADLAQTRALADKIGSTYERIDVLLNNAGGMGTKIHLTPDGYEQTYQVNYLSPFLLTTRLVDLLVESRASVINTTSSSHLMVLRATADDLENTARRRPSTAYALSKLAIMLFTKELHRRYRDSGLSVATVHPGYVNSNFGKASGSRMLAFSQDYLPTARYVASCEEGAEQLIWLASGEPGVDWTPGEYYSRRKIARASRLAKNPALAAELWERTLARIAD